MIPSEILKNLLKLFGIDGIKLPKRISLSFFSGNKTIIQNNTLYLNYSKLDNNEKKLILKYIVALKEYAIDYSIFEENSYQHIENIRSESHKFNEIKELKSVLTYEDYEALKDAVYIKYLSDKGKRNEIQKFKMQIRNKFGERGNTISNLYTTDYFHTIILPIYKEMSSKPEFLVDSFKAIFDKLIRDFPFAIFISSAMTISQIKDLIEKSAIKNIKYGIPSLHIHGINQTNCNNIKAAVDELEKEQKIKFKKSLEQKGDIILMTLEFTH